MDKKSFLLATVVFAIVTGLIAGALWWFAPQIEHRANTVFNPTQGMGADGSAVVGFPLVVAGVDGSGNVQYVLVGTDGALSIVVSDILTGVVDIGKITDVVEVDATGQGDVPVASDAHGDFLVDANTQQGDADVDSGNPLYVTITTPIEVIQSDADLLDVDANIQQGDADVGIGNPLYVTPTQDLSTQALGYNDSAWNPARQDKATEASIGIVYAHHQLHAGNAYDVHALSLDWDKGDDLNICFSTPDSATWLHLLPLIEATTATTFTLREGITANPNSGASYLARNRNRNAVGTLTSTVVSLAGVPGYVTVGATITTTGFAVHMEILGEGKKGGMSGGARDESEYVLAADTLYCFTLASSQVADNGLANIELTWYEHESRTASW